MAEEAIENEVVEEEVKVAGEAAEDVDTTVAEAPVSTEEVEEAA